MVWVWTVNLMERQLIRFWNCTRLDSKQGPWAWPGKGRQFSYFNYDGRVSWIWRSCTYRLIQKSCLISICCSTSYCLTFQANEVYHSLLDNLPLWRKQFILIMRVLRRFHGWRYYSVWWKDRKGYLKVKEEAVMSTSRIMKYSMVEMSFNPFLTHV